MRPAVIIVAGQTPKNITIRLSGGRCYASIQTEREVQPPCPTAASAVGIDVGIARFAPEASVLLAGALLGGYIGAQIGKRASAGVVRALTLALSTCITLAFFVKVYLS
jgi:hypothetical protein